MASKYGKNFDKLYRYLKRHKMLEQFMKYLELQKKNADQNTYN